MTLPLPDAAAVWAHPDWSQVRWAAETGRNHKTLARRFVAMGFRKTTGGRILAGPCVACGSVRATEELDERNRCLQGCHSHARVLPAEPKVDVHPAVALCRAEFAAFLLRPAGQRARQREHALEVRDREQGETFHLTGRAA